MMKLRNLIHALVLAGLSQVTLAGDFPKIVVSGFGTIGAVKTDYSNAYYRSSTVHSNGARRDWDPSVDSVLGIQARADITEHASIMLQTTSRKSPENSYIPEVNWASLNLVLPYGLNARIGRVRTPYFRFSDTIDVNFEREWVRPPSEMYSLNPFRDLDGLDVVYRTAFNGYLIEAQAYTGRSSLEVPKGKATLENIQGTRVSVSKDNLSVFTGISTGKLSLSTSDLALVGYGQIITSAGFGSVWKQAFGEEASTLYKSVGFHYENDDWTLTGEYAKREASKLYGNSHAWYLGTSRKLGKLTPFSYYARQTADSKAIESATNIPQLDEVLNITNKYRNNAQSSIVAGVRFDLQEKVAVKLQFERIRVDSNAWGIFRPVDKPDIIIGEGRPINVVGASVDFVF